MRHLDSGRKLGRTTEHRWALFRNQVNSLVLKERIETTLPKAKELRPLAEWFVTLGREKTLAAQRKAFNFSRSREVVAKLFSDLSPRFVGRPGGFTRIFKLGFRLGDAAPMAVIEFLPGDGVAPVPVQAKPAKATKGAKPKKPAREKKVKLETKDTLARKPVKEKRSFLDLFRRKKRGD